MFEIGQYLNINNNRGIVCYTGKYENVDYVCICFDENIYRFYSVTKDEEGYNFKSITNKEIVSKLCAMMASKELVGD
jgi:hypothetical protein